MKKMKVTAIVLLFVMIFNLMPVQVFAEAAQSEEQLREELRAAVDETKYPSGLFEFLTTRMNTSEDLSFVEFAIVRKGGTAGKASITLKAIDVTAKYGEDYTISIPKGIFSETLPENKEARPLIESAIIDESDMDGAAEEGEEQQDTTVTEAVYFNGDEEAGLEVEEEQTAEQFNDAAKDSRIGEVKEEQNISAPEQPATVAEEVYSEPKSEIEYEELTVPELKNSKEPVKKVSLREARDSVVGNKSNSLNWREAEQEEKESAQDALNETYQGIPGVSCVLDFEDGEYIKKIRFNTIDDKISEDEEQVLLVLLDPIEASLGEANNAFMNIQDNEEEEKVEFEIAEKSVSVNRNSGYAEITVKKTAGLHRYGFINVGTAALTAQPEIDYTPIMMELRFVPEQESQKVRVPILSGANEEELQFIIKLDDESPNLSETGNYGTIITIEPVKKQNIGIDYNSFNAMVDKSDGLQSMSPNSDMSLLSIIGYVGNQKVKKLTIKDVSWSNAKYDYGLGWIHMETDGVNQDKQVSFNADLRMVEKIGWDWSNSSKGTSYTHWDWSKFSMVDDYWKDYYSYMALPNGYGYSRGTQPFQEWTASLNLDDDCRKQTSIQFGTYVKKETRDSSFSLGTVILYYMPITIKLIGNKEDSDANIYPKIWDSTKTWDKAETSQYIGSMQFKNENSSTVNKAYYDGDTAYFAPKFASPEMGAKTYLWGYKIMRKEGLAGDRYQYVEGTSLDVAALYNGTMKDNKERPIKREEVLHDNNTIGIYPVFKARTAFVRINFDTEKGGMELNSFKDGDVLKVGMLDIIKFSGFGYSGRKVDGYSHGDINYKDKVIVTEADEKVLAVDGKNAIDAEKEILSNETKMNDIDEFPVNPLDPGKISFTPKKTFSNLTMQFDSSSLTVKLDPQSWDEEKNIINYADKGVIFYIPQGEEVEADPADPSPTPGTQVPTTWEEISANRDELFKNSKTEIENGKTILINPNTGDLNHELKIEKVNLNGNYIISAVHDPEFRIRWKDFTGDKNKDGDLSDEEERAVEKYADGFNRNTVAGDFFTYTVQHPESLVLYDFTPKPKGKEGKVEGYVYLKGGDILDNTKEKKEWENLKPIKGTKLNINGHELTTDENGHFILKHQDFITGDSNALSISYHNNNYMKYLNTNTTPKLYIDEYESFVPYDFTVFEGDKVFTGNDIRIQMTNKTGDFTFVFRVASRKSGLSAEKAHIRIYSREGIERLGPIEVIPDGGLYSFKFNPGANGVMPGDYMTVQLFDQYGNGYLENNVGFIFKKNLDTFTLLTSFDTPLRKAVSLVGIIDAHFDLGLAGKVDDYVTKTADEWTITFGFSAGWQDKFRNNAGGAKNELKDAAKSSNPEDTKNKVGESVDKDNPKKEKQGAKVTTEMQFGLSTSFYLKMIINKDKNSEYCGKVYFKEMIASATLTGNFSTKVEIQTPIGVTVFVKLELGGDITAILITEQFLDQKFYFDGQGKIDFSKGGTSDLDRHFSSYGKFMVNPYIIITVGAKIPLAEVSINGEARFTMNFTTVGSGDGIVRLSSELALKILIFDFKWTIVDETVDLFNYGNLRSFNANSIFAGEDYLYDSAEGYEVSSREYLNNREGWQGGKAARRMSLMAAGDNAYNEQTLQSGVYPYPYTLLAPIGENKQLLIFLDDDTNQNDRNRTQLFYSIYDGSDWSFPDKVDQDNTPDDNPWVEDMGDRILVVWSSAVDPVGETDTVIDVLNNRDIKASFFDKKSGEFGDVQNVTRQTENDIWSDTDPYIAYWKDKAGKENLMITYTKTQYEATGGSDEEDAVVGDIIKPSETFLAYRFYDFENNLWDESKDSGDGYYGQGFVDVSKYVKVDESDILISDKPFIYDPDNHENFDYNGDWMWNGYWSRVPKPSEVSLGTFGSDPLIVDSNAIGYENFAILAYSIDVDKDITTTNDRKLFIQLYSFTEERFYPPIYFDDTKGQADLEFLQADDNVYLYFISDGDIVSIDIGYLFAMGFLRYDIDGADSHVLVLNKLKEVYRKPEVIVEHSYDTRINEAGETERYNECPIDQFMVKSDDNNVYVMWTETGVTYKDGVGPNSTEGALAENRYNEKQIYASRQILGEVTMIEILDENDNPMKYPEFDQDGKPIDYNTVPDINYELGVVNAGDPVLFKSREKEWSEPVKLTNEKGANFNDIDFEILPDGNLRAVFVKGMSEVMEVAGQNMSIENINGRTLMTADFNIHVKSAEVSMEPIRMPEPNGILAVNIDLKNKNLNPLKDITTELYEIAGDSEVKVDERTDIDLRGGNSKKIFLNWQAPENITATKLRVLVKDGEEILASAEQDIIVKSIVDILDVSLEPLTRDKVKIQGTAINNGNIAAAGTAVYANASGTVIGSTSIENLGVGKEIYFEFSADLDSSMYESIINEDGSVTEKTGISVYADGEGISISNERNATKDDLDIINNIKTFEIKANNNRVTNNISLARGTSLNLVPELSYADESISLPRLVYISSNKDVADFGRSFMDLSGKNIGTTTITAYALPPNIDMILSRSGSELIDNFTKMADAGVKVKSFTVNVYRDAPSKDDDDRSSRNDGSSVVVTPPKTGTTVISNVATVSVTAQASVDKSGKAAAVVTSAQISSAVSKAIEEAKQKEGAVPKLEIKVEAPQDAKTIETSIPATAMREISNSSIESMTVNTPIAEIALDNKTMAGIADKAMEDIKITASEVEASSLSAEAQKLVGDRPIYDFSITSGVNIISQFDGYVTVSIPYTPKVNEDTSSIVIYFINDKGMPEIMSNCTYDAKTGTVSFKTDHFSKFAIGYNKVTFKDVALNAWYSTAVGFVAARGITTGTGDDNFSPDMKLTRVQLLVMAMRAYGIKPDEKWTDNFTDSGNAYYTNYLAAAKRLGITKGTGDNLFKPNSEITRQEMFALLYNTLKLIDQLPEGRVGKALTDFDDADGIAPWALDAMAMFAENGIVSGSNGKLNPEDTGSRAQMAQVIYNLLSR